MTSPTNKYDEPVSLHGPVCSNCHQRIGGPYTDVNGLNVCHHCKPDMSKDMYAVLEECEEYFDARADADHNGERYVGNAEMKLLVAIRLVLAKAGSR